MTGKHDRTGHVRRREQRVEIVDAVLDGTYASGGGIALSESSPVVAADACETGDLGLNSGPGFSAVARARLEQDRRGTSAGTDEKEGTATDFDPGPRRRGCRQRLRRGVFSSDDAHGKSKGQGDAKQEHNAPQMATVHKRLPVNQLNDSAT